MTHVTGLVLSRYPFKGQETAGRIMVISMTARPLAGSGIEYAHVSRRDMYPIPQLN